MALATGARLGPYEILGPLGAGGMGEVYRARDTRLGREVAIKVLPPHLADSADRRERFEREARAVAALSHPNILALHDIGREGETAFAVMELLEGETLRERLKTGPLPLRKVIDYATQTALGLAAAHAQGIVHRDLKPENLFLTRDGRLKILDFGLAHQTALGQTADETSSPTLERRTAAGMLLGTAGYMSPEQVRGEEADLRSDIFSFGCVLHEMLSGRRAFQRETAAETMTAVLREEPESLAQTLPEAPPALERIVTHCLEKAPDERFQSARDLAFDLQSLSTVSAAEPLRAPRGRGGRRLRAAALALLAVLGGVTVGWLLGRGSERPGAGAAPVSFVQLTDQPGVESDPALAPDGKTVVYTSDVDGQLDLFLLRVGGRNPVALTADSSADDSQPAFSPEGGRIAFRSEREGGGIFIMESTGESVRRLSDSGFHPSWSPDGREIVVSTTGFFFPTDRSGVSGELWAIAVATGKKRPVLRGGDAVQPAWSPGGRRIAYWGLRPASGQRDLWTAAADGSETQGVPVTEDAPLDWSPTWAPDGRHLYFSSTRGGTMNLWRVPIDETTGRVLGAPEALTTPASWSGHYSLASDGKRIAFESLDWRSTLLRVAFDPVAEKTVGSPVPVLRTTQPIRDHQFSPDGEWVAFTRPGAREDLFLARADGRQYRRLTDDPFRDRGPAWSPDGRRLAFYSDRGGNYEIWTIHPDGSGLEPLTREGRNINFPVWSPDGRRIASARVGLDWLILDVGPPVAVKTMPPIGDARVFWPLSWSPDGSRIAGITARADGQIAGVALYALASGRYQAVPGGGVGWQWIFPKWLRDSRRLLVRDHSGIALLDPATGRTKRLLAVSGYMVGASVGVSPDDRWITYTETATDGDVWLMTLK